MTEIKFNVLIAEDEENIGNFISAILKTNGYKPIIATTGNQAIQCAESYCPDVILLDLGLPDMDGIDVISEIRKWAVTPIIVISARNRESEKVKALDAGADDYITKPYNPTILMLRISAVIKRTRKQDSSEADTGEKGIYQYRQAAVNTAKGTLSRGEKELVLTKNEMIIFLSLLNNIGKIVSRDELMTALWDNEEYINDNALTVNISRLRAKLSDFGYEDAIETRKKQGYCLV